ncbi:MAG: DUF21 domain-containing protein [Candidatus Eisenbacteria bacterium]|nr:DUF21 domain-containing protein [Candidatus Eisenbacteria bacterium]
MSVVLLIAVVYVMLAVAASAFFSATEMAILSANRYTLRRRQRSGAPAVHRAANILAQRNQRLATNLVGVNVFNISASAVATYLVERAMGIGWQASVVTTAGMTIILLIAAEIIPKIYARQAPERLLVTTARALDVIHLFFLPVTRGLALYVNLLLRVIKRTETGTALSREELKSLLRETRGGSGPVQREQKMLHSILEFSDTVAREVMIPMVQVVAVERGASVEQWRQLVRRHGYTRLPVYENRIDRVVGVVNIFDLHYDPERGRAVEDYMRSIPIVPETKLIDRLLLDMQRTRNPMAVVVNEFGSCIGIVSIEDIVEEIVGEMVDEHEAEVRRIRRIAARTFIVDGLTDIDDLNEELHLQLPKERYDTVGGLVLKRFGRIPRVGDTFTFRRIQFEVIDVYRYGVRSTKLILPEERKEDEA